MDTIFQRSFETKELLQRKVRSTAVSMSSIGTEFVDNYAVNYNDYIQKINYSPESNARNLKCIKFATLANLGLTRNPVISAGVFIGGSIVLGQPGNINPF